MDHFRDQARYLRNRLDTGRLANQDIRSNVSHLLEDARSVQLLPFLY